MIEVHPGVFVGTAKDCGSEDVNGFDVIHACKYPCYVNQVGAGIPGRDHPDYLHLETPTDLFLNMVDSPVIPVEFGNPMFERAIAFLHARQGTAKRVLIHCNLGQSRSPGIALAYMAWLCKIPNLDYDTSRKAFSELYEDYRPGNGVRDYLTTQWDWLMER